MIEVPLEASNVLCNLIILSDDFKVFLNQICFTDSICEIRTCQTVSTEVFRKLLSTKLIFPAVSRKRHIISENVSENSTLA